jgi:hypothetical protein
VGVRDPHIAANQQRTFVVFNPHFHLHHRNRDRPESAPSHIGFTRAQLVTYGGAILIISPNWTWVRFSHHCSAPYDYDARFGWTGIRHKASYFRLVDPETNLNLVVSRCAIAMCSF